MAQQRLIPLTQIENVRRRNVIINGDFEIWQRGTSFSLDDSAIYTADRWAFGPSSTASGVSGTLSRQDFVQGSTEVPGEPRYYLRVDVTAAASGDRWEVYQRIEGVRTFAGEQATLSFYARAGSNRSDFRIRLVQVYDGNAGTANEAGIATGQDITTDFQKYTYTFDVPHTNEGGSPSEIDEDFNFLQIVFAFDTVNAIETLDISHVQFEPGPNATNFDNKLFGEELALCQRYFQKSYPAEIAPGTSSQADNGHPYFRAQSGIGIAGSVVFPTRMRVSPTMTAYRPSTGSTGTVETIGQEGIGGSPDTPFIDSFEHGETGFSLVRSNAGPFTIGATYQFHYTADAEL